MALGFDRLVTYERQPFKQTNFLHDPVSIKREPGIFEYVRKDPEIFSIEEPWRYFGKEKSVLGDCELTSWINKHPKHWTKKEVLDWIFSVVESDNLDGSRVQGEAYRDFTGENLYEMTKEDFKNVDPSYGVKMYETFRNLVKNISFEKPSQVSDLQGLDDFNHLNSELYQKLSKDILERVNSSSHTGRNDNSDSSCAYSGARCHSASVDSLKVIKTDNDVKVDIPSLGVYSISQDIEFPFSCSMYQNSAARMETSSSFLTPPDHFSGQFTSSIPSSFSYSTSSSTYAMSTTAMDQLPVKYPDRWHPNIPVSVQSSPARSTSSSSLESSPRRTDDKDPGYVSDDSTMAPVFIAPAQGNQPDDDVDMLGYDQFYPNKSYDDGGHGGQQGGEKPRNGKKSRNNATKNGNHLWEFVRDLLRDPATNPKLLKWEDRENGVFRFLQSEAVAQLWGEKKNNPQMTYEKLSRAMRFCRSAGYFESVPKNGKFPKKLCFMFGGRAHGWRD